MIEQLTIATPESAYPIGAQWVRENPAAAELVIEWAKAENESGYSASMQSCIEKLRERGMLAASTATPYKFDHRMRTEVSRYLMAVSGVRFRIRKSHVDAQATYATPVVSR